MFSVEVHGEIDLLQQNLSSSHSFVGFTQHTKEQCDLCALPSLSWLSATKPSAHYGSVNKPWQKPMVQYYYLLEVGHESKQTFQHHHLLTRSTLPLGNMKVGCPERTISYLIYCCCTFITRNNRSFSNLLPPTTKEHTVVCILTWWKESALSHASQYAKCLETALITVYFQVPWRFCRPLMRFLQLTWEVHTLHFFYSLVKKHTATHNAFPMKSG